MPLMPATDFMFHLMERNFVTFTSVPFNDYISLGNHLLSNAHFQINFQLKLQFGKLLLVGVGRNPK